MSLSYIATRIFEQLEPLTLPFRGGNAVYDYFEKGGWKGARLRREFLENPPPINNSYAHNPDGTLDMEEMRRRDNSYHP